MANIIKRVWNQNRMVQIEDLKGMTFQAEQAGHTFQISGIDDEGNTVALTGTPAGVLLRPDNTDVALTCSVSGGVVSATLPANCYDVPGRFGLTIFITSGSSKTAIYAAVGTVTRTSSGTAAPGTTQSVVDLINAINAAINSIPASYSNLLADIAPTYSDSALYAVGQYAWYDGDLKRCIVPITTAESYTAAHWTSAVLGQDVSDLKSAINVLIDNEGSGLNDPDGYFGNPLEYFLNTSSKWALVGGSGSHYLIPIKSGDIISITANSTNNAAYAIFKSYVKAENNKSPDFSSETGFTERISVTKGTTAQVTAPTDGRFLCIDHGYGTYDMEPISVIINGIEQKKGIRSYIEETNKNVEELSDIAKTNGAFQSDRLTSIDGNIYPYMEYGFISNDGSIQKNNKYLHGTLSLNVGDTVALSYAISRGAIGMMVNGVWDSIGLSSSADNFTIETAGEYLIHIRKPDTTTILPEEIEELIGSIKIRRVGDSLAKTVEEISGKEDNNSKNIEDIKTIIKRIDNYPVVIEPKYNKELWNDMQLHDNSKRICTDVFPVTAGTTICIYRGSGQGNLQYWKDEFKTENLVISTSWIAKNWFYYTFQFDGFAYVIFRKNASNPDYPLSDYDGEISIFNNTAKQIQGTTEQFVLDRSITVSDTTKYTVGDGNLSVFDKDRGIVYLLYNTSETAYGESHDIIALAMFPVLQPWNVKTIEVCRAGGLIGGETVSETREENIVFISSTQIRLLLYFSTNVLGMCYRYIDYNPVTDTFGELGTCKITLGSAEKSINAYDVRQYVSNNGGTFNAIELVIPTKLNIYNDVLYATICPGAKGNLSGDPGGNTIVVTSNDYGANFTVKSIIPVIGIYETALAKDSDGLLYALVRPTPNTSELQSAYEIWVSDDDGETFTNYEFFRTSTTRPQMITYKGKILVLNSTYDSKTPIPNRTGTNTLMTDRNRNNLIIRLGSGTNKDNFITKFSAFGKHELTYYSAIIVDDVVYISYLSNDLYGKTKGTKNCIKFARLGEFYTDNTPTDWFLT